MSQAVKRACDACHRRKVKCDGLNPCRNCSTAQLSCTYNAIPQKKGPKGSRAKVISELRETQRQTSLSAKVQNRMGGGQQPPPSPSLNPTPGLLTGEIVKSCVDYFFTNLYPQMPILDRRQVEAQISSMEQNRDIYCLLTSLCAFVVLQPGFVVPGIQELELKQFGMQAGFNIVSCQLLIEETLRVRKGYDYLDPISFNALATNFFLLASYYAQEMHDRAWFYLREATTMIHMANMTSEENLRQFNPGEICRRRRLYWLFHAHERAYAIQRHRPMTLQATINLPTLADDPSESFNHNLDGFMDMARLFRPMDDGFMATWNKARGHLSAQQIATLQRQLNDFMQTLLCQEPAAIDMATNQGWIKNLLWNARSSNLDRNGDTSLSFQYGMEAARDQMLNMASQFSNNNMEAVGSGFIEKLLETSSSLMDFLVTMPTPSDPHRVTPDQNLKQLLSIIAITRMGNYHFLPLLLSKVTEILPRLTNPVLQRVPDSAIMMADIDIFDGFGNAGMAQVPQMPMSIEPNEGYERKYAVEEYDNQFQMDMNGSTPESMGNSNPNQTPPSIPPNDLSTAFVGSPAVMSPGMEYTHNMNNFACTPLPDMVMSPLGNPGQSNSMNQLQGQHQQHLTPDALLGGISQNMNMMYGLRQPPQRQSSYQLQGQPAIGAVGDYQGLQRSNAEASRSIGAMGDMNFNSLQ